MALPPNPKSTNLGKKDGNPSPARNRTKQVGVLPPSNLQLVQTGIDLLSDAPATDPSQFQGARTLEQPLTGDVPTVVPAGASWWEGMKRTYTPSRPSQRMAADDEDELPPIPDPTDPDAPPGDPEAAKHEKVLKRNARLRELQALPNPTEAQLAEIQRILDKQKAATILADEDWGTSFEGETLPRGEEWLSELAREEFIQSFLARGMNREEAENIVARQAKELTPSDAAIHTAATAAWALIGGTTESMEGLTTDEIIEQVGYDAVLDSLVDPLTGKPINTVAFEQIVKAALEHDPDHVFQNIKPGAGRALITQITDALKDKQDAEVAFVAPEDIDSYATKLRGLTILDGMNMTSKSVNEWMNQNVAVHPALVPYMTDVTTSSGVLSLIGSSDADGNKIPPELQRAALIFNTVTTRRKGKRKAVDEFVKLQLKSDADNAAANKLTTSTRIAVENGDFLSAAQSELALQNLEVTKAKNEENIWGLRQFVTFYDDPGVLGRLQSMGLIGELETRLGIKLDLPERADTAMVQQMFAAMGPIPPDQFMDRLSEMIFVTGWNMDELVKYVKGSGALRGLSGGGQTFSTIGA